MSPENRETVDDSEASTGSTGAPDGRVAVAGAAATAPRFRIDAETVADAWGRFRASGVESKAVAGADEDALTMGAEAARLALDAADIRPETVGLLAFATATPPLDAEDPTPRLGEFLGVPAGATRRYCSGSTRAGTQALLAAADTLSADASSTAGDTASAGDPAPALVVVADCPQGEPDSPEDHAAGAGAAAFVLTADGPVRLVDRAEYAVEYPGTRFRRRGSDRVKGLGVTSYDRQAFVETVVGAVDRLDDGPAGDDGDPAPDGDDSTPNDDSAPDYVALQASDGKLPYRAAGPLGVESAAISAVTPVHDLGDLGAASAPVALVRALTGGADDGRPLDDGARLLAVGYGAGSGADALLFEVGDEGASSTETGTSVPTTLSLGGEASVSYAEYLRLRGEVTGDPPAGGGAMVSVPSWRRTRASRYRLAAGRCPKCGALAFPPEGACPACHALVEFEPTRLAREGTVEAVTGVSPGGAPPEFALQGARGGGFGVAIVAFEAADDGEATANAADTPTATGETASLPMQVTDADPDDVAAGDAVEAVVRRIYTQEGVTRYGVKARPLADGKGR